MLWCQFSSLATISVGLLARCLCLSHLSHPLYLNVTGVDIKHCLYHSLPLLTKLQRDKDKCSGSYKRDKDKINPYRYLVFLQFWSFDSMIEGGIPLPKRRHGALVQSRGGRPGSTSWLLRQQQRRSWTASDGCQTRLVSSGLAIPTRSVVPSAPEGLPSHLMPCLECSSPTSLVVPKHLRQTTNCFANNF